MLSAVGCVSGQKSVPTSAFDATSSADYYPMPEGAVWSYDVDTGTALPTLAITKVLSVDGKLASIQTSQSPPLTYERREAGVFNTRDNVWLLKSPLSVGASWPSRGGRKATIAAIGETTTTLGGSFEPCVRVRESGLEAELQIETVYCLGVGPVRIQSTMTSKLTTEVSVAKATLRGYSLTPLAH